jgi:hypothetical protein
MCRHRVAITTADGFLMVCHHPDSRDYLFRVTENICAACAFNRLDLQIEVPDGGPTIVNDGTIVYKKRGWEPPLHIDGYERDEENRWVFHPLWPECDTREAEAFIVGVCQCLQMKMFCDGQPVSLERCRQCRAMKA